MSPNRLNGFDLSSFYLQCSNWISTTAAHCLATTQRWNCRPQCAIELHSSRLHVLKVYMDFILYLITNWFDLNMQLGSVGLLIRLCYYSAPSASNQQLLF